MLIKSLRMLNFRQFIDLTEVEFSVDPEKNVTVILGDNTFGKTTLLQAFNWCFYEKVLFSDNPDDLLNYEKEAKMYVDQEEKVEVEIKLLHDGNEYVITRTQLVTKKYNGFNKRTFAKIICSYKDEKGKTVTKIIESPNEIKKLINTILPEELSKYFFFDTERVNSISTKKDVADAVKGLLGLSALDNAKKHIGTRSNKSTALGILLKEFGTDGNKEAEATLEAIHKAQAQKEIYHQEVETAKNQIKYYETRKEQLEAVLRDNKKTSELQTKKQKLEKQVKDEEAAQLSMAQAFRNDFNNGCMAFFAQPLLKQAESFLKAVEIDDKGIKDLSKPTLLEILKRGKCICGCELVEGSDAYNHILEEMKFVPPESIGNTVRNYLEQMNGYRNRTDAFLQGINSRYTELYRSKNRVIEYTSDIEDISEQIKGAEDVRNYEIELQEVKVRLKEQNIKKDNAIRNESLEESNIASKQKLYDSLLAKNAKYVETMQYVRYAEEILSWLEETYNDKESYIRDALEDRVNEIFERMYHGKRRVVIDKKFNVELLTIVSDKERNTGKSEGLDRVKNFAFIGGLVALAKEKIISKAGEHEIDLASEPYPLVMDAPFSNADEEHTGNISRVLPEVAEQVIMFVMKKDFKIAEPVMRSRIGKEFTLTKYSETNTALK